MADIKGVPVSEVRGIGESWRWFAPETTVGTGVMTLASDIWSFGMTILEVM